MKRRTAGVALGSLLVAGVVAGAVLSPGYVAVQPELDGSSVWIANAEAGVIGLANTANSTVEQVIRVGAADEAFQAAGGTVIVDRDTSTIRVVRAGATQPGPSVPIVAGAEVDVRGDRVVVTSPSTGDVWRTTMGALAEGATLAEATGAARQEDITLSGHALQCRVTTEDPQNNFLPDIGRLLALLQPA